MLKTIFFDNDGVLVDTERLYYLANKEIFAELGLTLTEELFRTHFLKHANGILHFLAPLNLSPEQIGEIRSKREVIYQKLLREEDILIPGVSETIEALHQEYQLAIVTSSRKENVEIIHGRTGFLRFFDFVISEQDYQHAKPHPEPYLTALKRAAVSPQQAIVIEDSERGLIAAREAGLDCVVIPNELSLNSDFSQATTILQSIEQLQAYLKSR